MKIQIYSTANPVYNEPQGSAKSRLLQPNFITSMTFQYFPPLEKPSLYNVLELIVGVFRVIHHTYTKHQSVCNYNE
jgi:hypothetical protein